MALILTIRPTPLSPPHPRFSSGRLWRVGLRTPAGGVGASAPIRAMARWMRLSALVRRNSKCLDKTSSWTILPSPPMAAPRCATGMDQEMRPTDHQAAEGPAVMSVNATMMRDIIAMTDDIATKSCDMDLLSCDIGTMSWSKRVLLRSKMILLRDIALMSRNIVPMSHDIVPLLHDIATMMRSIATMFRDIVPVLSVTAGVPTCWRRGSSPIQAVVDATYARPCGPQVPWRSGRGPPLQPPWQEGRHARPCLPSARCRPVPPGYNHAPTAPGPCGTRA